MLTFLKDIAIITMGQSPKSTAYNSKHDGMPFLQGRTTFGRIYPTINTWSTAYNKIANKGDLLFTVRAPVGDVNIADQDIAIGRGIAAIKPTKCNPKYLYYLLVSNKDIFLSFSTGTIYDSINKIDLAQIKLDLHSLIEQQHIVDTIGSIDELIENNSCYIEKLNYYLGLLFADISKNTSLFISLREIITFKKGKKPVKTNSKNFGKPYLTIDAIENKYTIFTNDTKGVSISENDIMMVMDGASSGKVFIGAEGYLGSTLAKIVNLSNYSTYSIFLFLKANEKIISKNTTGSAIPHANKNYILDLSFPVINQTIDDYLYSIFSTLIDKQKENCKLKVLKDIYLDKYFH